MERYPERGHHFNRNSWIHEASPLKVQRGVNQASTLLLPLLLNIQAAMSNGHKHIIIEVKFDWKKRILEFFTINRNILYFCTKVKICLWKKLIKVNFRSYSKKPISGVQSYLSLWRLSLNDTRIWCIIIFICCKFSSTISERTRRNGMDVCRQSENSGRWRLVFLHSDPLP